MNSLAMISVHLRRAARSLSRRPLLASIAIVTLALGVGANTAIFSIVNAVLLRPLPFRDAERLVMVWSTPRNQQLDQGPMSYLDFRDLKEQGRTIDAMASVWTFPNGDVNLTGGREPQRISVARVSTGFFEVLGVPPLLGRTFREDETVVGSHRRAILSYGLWQSGFGGDSTLVGRAVIVNGFPYEVVGIMPPELQSRGVKLLGTDVQVWRPLAPDDGQTGGRGSRKLRVVARLAPDATLASVQADLAAAGDRLAESYPQTNREIGITITPLRDAIVRDTRRALEFLLAAVLAVLLGACANVANLLLVRAAGNRSDSAVRSALGASPLHLSAPVLAESVILGVAGSAVGVGVAYAIVQIVVTAAPSDIPLLADARIDGPVLWFAILTTIATVLVVGSVPALRAARPDVGTLLRQAGASRAKQDRNVLRTLTVVQIAVAMVLLTAGGVMMQSFAALLRVNPGIDVSRGLTFQLELPMGAGMPYERQPARDAFFADLRQRLERLPGVRGFALASGPPFEEDPVDFTFGRADVPDDVQHGTVRVISHDYFQVLGIPMVRGRAFEITDSRETARVAIVSESVARGLWGRENPIGRRVRFAFGEEEGIEVVGVASDVRTRGLDHEPTRLVYLPALQRPYNFMSVTLKSSGDPNVHIPYIRKAVRELDSNLPIHRLRTLDQLAAQSIARQRFQTLLVGSFSLLVLILAVIGTYGVAAYGVSERAGELGIRLALGATGGDIRKLVLREGIRLAAFGIIAGSIVAATAGMAFSRIVFEAEAPDPLLLTLIPIALGVAVVGATWFPAQRAARLDPMRVLRAE